MVLQNAGHMEFLPPIRGLGCFAEKSQPFLYPARNTILSRIGEALMYNDLPNSSYLSLCITFELTFDSRNFCKLLVFFFSEDFVLHW